MAISSSFQNSLYAKSADRMEFRRNAGEAEALRDELRTSGLYRRVEMRRWNNGSRERPIWEYKINAWIK